MEQVVPVPTPEIELDNHIDQPECVASLVIEETAYKPCNNAKPVADEVKAEPPKCPPLPPICRDPKPNPEPEPEKLPEPVAEAAPTENVCPPCPPCPGGDEALKEAVEQEDNPCKEGDGQVGGDGQNGGNGAGAESLPADSSSVDPCNVGKDAAGVKNENGETNGDKESAPTEEEPECENEDDYAEPPKPPRAPCPEPLYPLCKPVEPPCQHIVCPQDD